MKIAIPYENGNVFQHFGKTSQFKIYTVDEMDILSSEVVDTAGSGHEALAEFLKEKGVGLVICGGIGAGAVAALRQAGIQLFGGAAGAADDQVRSFLDGNLHFGGGAACSHEAYDPGEGDGNIPACGGNCGVCRH